MVQPREGEMDYNKIDELSAFYMFISACLTENQRNELKKEWEACGGYKNIPWWKFVMENTSLKLDFNTNSDKCWRKGGCPFNSNNSSNYLKCKQEGYSVEQCKVDNEKDFINKEDKTPERDTIMIGILKKFGILTVNKEVECRFHPNPNYMYVLYNKDWHTVPKDDIELLN